VTLHTASEVISLGRKLENDLAKFYENISASYAQDKEIFLNYSRENVKNIKQVEKAYYGAASDAMEGTFAFNIEENDFTFETHLAGNYAEVLDKAIEIEKMIARFYEKAAGQSQSLVGDVPRVFRILVKKRAERVAKLESLKPAGEAR
jgi:hypothetical protein